MFLADQTGSERISGEPTDADIATALEHHGVSRDETALFMALKVMGPNLIKHPDRALDLAGNLYSQLARSGVPGFREYTNEEKIAISAQPQMRDKLLAQMTSQTNEFAKTKLNPLLQQLSLPQFEVTEDSKLIWPHGDGAELIAATSPDSKGRIGEIARQMSEYRDHHLFNKIADAKQNGKRPFVVYGGSHIVALKPILDHYLK